MTASSDNECADILACLDFVLRLKASLIILELHHRVAQGWSCLVLFPWNTISLFALREAQSRI